jgi:uncharacterized UBP type Zn finger protein
MSDYCHNCSNFTDDGDILRICKMCFERICEERDTAVESLEHSAKLLDRSITLAEQLQEMQK